MSTKMTTWRMHRIDAIRLMSLSSMPMTSWILHPAGTVAHMVITRISTSCFGDVNLPSRGSSFDMLNAWRDQCSSTGKSFLSEENEGLLRGDRVLVNFDPGWTHDQTTTGTPLEEICTEARALFGESSSPKRDFLWTMPLRRLSMPNQWRLLTLGELLAIHVFADRWWQCLCGQVRVSPSPGHSDFCLSCDRPHTVSHTSATGAAARL